MYVKYTNWAILTYIVHTVCILPTVSFNYMKTIFKDIALYEEN